MKRQFTILLTLTALFFSCKKEVNSSTDQTNQTGEQTVNVREVLTKQPWKLKQIRALLGNTLSYYLRDGQSNTVNFDKEYISLKTDNTGTYFNGDSAYVITSWDFKDAALSSLVYNVAYRGETVPVTWENLKVTADSISYSEFFTRNGQTALSVATRIPTSASNPQ